MKKKDYILEIGMVAAIIADTIMEALYEEKQERGTGYIDTVEEISKWSVEFVDKYKKINWEAVLEKGMKRLSKNSDEIMCWDDAVMDFANYKLEQFKKKK
jgi:hypothetical protein